MAQLGVSVELGDWEAPPVEFVENVQMKLQLLMVSSTASYFDSLSRGHFARLLYLAWYIGVKDVVKSVD